MVILRRRKFIINKDLQYRFALLSIFYVAAFLSVLGGALFIPLAIQMETIDFNLDAHLYAADRFLYLHKVFWPVALASILTICVHAIYVSHRLAGPLYRFMRTFTDVAEGKLPKAVRLREKDYLKEETEVINAMLSNLREEIGALQEEQAQMSVLISSLGDATRGGSEEETREALLAVSEKEKEIVARLNSFKVE